jgi:hypothetical protein
MTTTITPELGRPITPQQKSTFSRQRIEIIVRSLPPFWTAKHNCLSLTRFRWLWMLLVFLHLIFTIHFICLAYVHIYISQPIFEYERRTIGLLINLNVPAALCMFVSVLHAWSILRMFQNRSMKRRKERFKLCSCAIEVIYKDNLATKPVAATKLTYLARLYQWYTKYLSRDGIFGLYSDLYKFRIVLQYSISILAQTYQVYKVMKVSPSPLICFAYALCVTGICIISPLMFTARIHRVLQKTGAVLSTTIFAVILECFLPWIAIMPYADYFVVSTKTNVDYLYDDIWFLSAIHACHHVFLRSIVDYFSRLFPCILACWNLILIETSITEAFDNNYGIPLSPHKPNNNKDRKSSFVMRFKKHLYNSSKCGKWVGILWGLAVLALSLVYSTFSPFREPCNSGCLTQLSPWFSLKCHCILHVVNCHTHNLRNQIAIENELELLYPEDLQSLIIAHCPNLVVPSISRFKALIGFEIYNSSIVDWPDTAAIHANDLQHLAILLIVKTNLTTIPRAIVDDIPLSLLDIEIVDSPIQELTEYTVTKFYSEYTLY